METNIELHTNPGNVSNAANQQAFSFTLPDQCAQCDGWCGWWVDVIYLWAGKAKEWRRCSVCRGRGAVLTQQKR